MESTTFYAQLGILFNNRFLYNYFSNNLIPYIDDYEVFMMDTNSILMIICFIKVAYLLYVCVVKQNIV